jgi:hypothetical protein
VGEVFDLFRVGEPVLIDVLEVDPGIGQLAVAQLLKLMALMKVLHGLFESDGDQEADDDGGDVDEEVAPGVGGVVGWVYVEHGGGFLGWGLRRGGDLGLGQGGGLLFRRVGHGVWREVYIAESDCLLVSQAVESVVGGFDGEVFIFECEGNGDVECDEVVAHAVELLAILAKCEEKVVAFSGGERGCGSGQIFDCGDFVS